LLSVSCAALPRSLSDHLSPGRLAEVELLRREPLSRSPKEIEERYQTLVQRQTFPDFAEIYDPKNEDQLQITYARFTQEDQWGGGPDRGFGLEVIKKLVLSLDAGHTKTIVVNEHWSQDRNFSGLFYPDEIRGKTQVYDGARSVRGSERLYLFDSFRIAWAPEYDEDRGKPPRPVLYRQSLYSTSEDSRPLEQRRVPVSAPISCTRCHRSGNEFAKDFLETGERMNHESIVQDNYFNQPIEATQGFTEYLEDLNLHRDPQDRVEQIRAALLNPKRSMRVPGLYEALLGLAANQLPWLAEDKEFTGLSMFGSTLLAGVYPCSLGFCVDAIEAVVEGKYLWWQPAVAIP
jgi:hypothetical protein